jgi:arginase
VREDQPDPDDGAPSDQMAERPLVPRPLGSAPLLDSKPMPATRPGMLRPRIAGDSFSLPTQRPAFDIGPESRADIT